jgi:hypothetical protein
MWPSPGVADMRQSLSIAKEKFLFKFSKKRERFTPYNTHPNVSSKQALFERSKPRHHRHQNNVPFQNRFDYAAGTCHPKFSPGSCGNIV